MDAINLLATPNFKTTYICSDHFDDKSFHDSDELRSRKRLRPDAVPQRISFKKSGNYPEKGISRRFHNLNFTEVLREYFGN